MSDIIFQFLIKRKYRMSASGNTKIPIYTPQEEDNETPEEEETVISTTKYS